MESSKVDFVDLKDNEGREGGGDAEIYVGGISIEIVAFCVFNVAGAVVVALKLEGVVISEVDHI